ncbi:hypothetical protein EBU02_08950 [bacterium]|nr:hypothetical protein [bacterium]
MEKPTLNLKPQQAITEAVWILLILAVGLAAFTWNHESVFFGGEVYFTDGDCYARMTRVRMIEAEGLHSIRSHTFENFPEGTKPHTTMPLDALIAGLSQILRPFFSNHLSACLIAARCCFWSLSPRFWRMVFRLVARTINRFFYS